MKKNILSIFILLSAFMATNAQVGINTTNPQGAFHIDSKGDTAPNGANSVDDVIVTNTGNVGIGVINPTQKVSIKGDVRITKSLVSDVFTKALSTTIRGKVGLGTISSASATQALAIKPSSSSQVAMKIESSPSDVGKYLASDAAGNAYWTTFVPNSPNSVVGLDANGRPLPLCNSDIVISTGSLNTPPNPFVNITKKPLVLSKGKWIILAKFTARNYTTTGNLGTDMLVWMKLESYTTSASIRKNETQYGFRPEMSGWNVVTPQLVHLVELKETTTFLISTFLPTPSTYKTFENSSFGGSYFCAVRLDEN